QTFRRAVFARYRAGNTRVDTPLIFFVWHFISFLSLGRSKPSLGPALHLLDFFVLIFRNLRRQFLQLGVRPLLLDLLGHFHRHVVVLRHHLEKCLVEVGVMFVAQHRHMHFHLLVRGLVGDRLR